MRRYKWNILLIVMFILFVTSLVWLLIVKYIQNMIDYSTEFFKYYKAYYISNAWIELSLVKINNHWFWFEDKILSWSDTISKNFINCWSKNCKFSSQIRNLSHVISNDKKTVNINNCSLDSTFSLNKWQWVIVPLFWDKNLWEWTLSWANYVNISPSDFSNITLNLYHSSNKYFTIWVADINNSSRNIVEKNMSWDPIGLQLNSSEFNNFYDDSLMSFLVIWNTENYTSLQKLCVNSPLSKLPSNYMVVESIWNFNEKFVSIEAVKLKAIPDYLIYNIIWN